MNGTKFRYIASRVFLRLAYLAVILQWLWVLAIGLPLLIDTGVFDAFTPPAAPVQPTIDPEPAALSPIMLVVVGVITLVCLGITMIVLIRLPKTIADTSDKAVHKAAEAVIPIVAHHQNLPTKKRQLLSRRIMAVLQLTLIVVPLVLSFFLPGVKTLTHDIIVTLTAILGGIGAICFVLYWTIRTQKVTSRTRSRVSRE